MKPTKSNVKSAKNTALKNNQNKRKGGSKNKKVEKIKLNKNKTDSYSHLLPNQRENENIISAPFNEPQSNELVQERKLYNLRPRVKKNLIETKENCKLLDPKVTSVELKTKEDAEANKLLQTCLSTPITLVRGLAHMFELDMSLFSTKTLAATDPKHAVEVRIQRQQPSEENWDESGKKRVWKCISKMSSTTLLEYAKYQEQTPVLSTTAEDNISFKEIKFGTNLDLSDEDKWQAQFREIEKLPEFMRFNTTSNMLSHVGYKIYGVNTMQMYLKVQGCRTPGHQENNNFCSVNLNIGPDDCEWFGVAEQYWPIIEKMCQQNGNLDYLTGSWWPNLQELIKHRIPVFKFVQRAGDLIWVNAGCVHWVQSNGCCNNVSWNVGPMVYSQYKSAIERYEWNKKKYYKSLVPMLHLTWSIARKVKFTDPDLLDSMKDVMMGSLKQCELIINQVKKLGMTIEFQERLVDEPVPYCNGCDSEIFNILFLSKKPTNKNTHDVYCDSCVRKGNIGSMGNLVVLQQYRINELKRIFESFQLKRTTRNKSKT